MSQPFNLASAASFLAKTFDDYAGGKSRVAFVGLDQQGRMLVAVAWDGDELVTAMQVEAFLVKQGETIVQRSRKHGSITMLAYKMKQQPGK